ncbi:GNAT family N-acetyltransferase [Caulobacter soli]|uniref:GNAT family N-acetyltransferase n=1 Tax=Caulobacter soli TaxID=2708539 RepID=UPI0013EA34A2|nr:GNAT family N-acetyltransferase [Caulobacter soli]
MKIIAADLDDARVIALLEHHVATAAAETARGSAHALNPSGLKSLDIEVWAAWAGERLLGLGALKGISPDHGEIKSMHVAQVERGRGVGGAILRHIIQAARHRNMRRLSLETGSWPFFEPARALYRRHGFGETNPFGDYVEDPNSVFMTLVLEPASMVSR